VRMERAAFGMAAPDRLRPFFAKRAGGLRSLVGPFEKFRRRRIRVKVHME
jgi:hypothetical protein